MRKKILIIAIAALLVIGFMPISLVTVFPPEAEAGRLHIENCRLEVRSDYIGIVCDWFWHDH